MRVATQRALEWSPQQIAGWLRQAYPDDPTMRVSHETIYLSLFVQSRGVLKKALMTHLRQRRTYRRPKGAAAHSGGHIVDAVSLRERPATVEDRAVPGHWEGDLLVGARQSYVATLVERALALRLLGPGHRKRDADGRAGAPAARPATSCGADGHADLRSRPGTGSPSHFLDRDGRPGLLL